MPRRAKRPGPGRPSKSELNTVPPGQPYGERQRMEQQLQAVPITPAGPNLDDLESQAAQFPFSPVGVSSPSARPGEPITAGLPLGPGAGPSATSATGGMTPAEAKLRAIARVYPTPELLDLLEDLNNGRSF